MSNVIMAAEIKAAMDAHDAWKLRLKAAIAMGRSDISPAQASCDNLCQFGKWFYSPSIDVATKEGVPYRVVRRLHAEFHECAGRVLAQALAGKRQEAIRLLDGEFRERSNKLVRALTRWRSEVMSEPGATTSSSAPAHRNLGG